MSDNRNLAIQRVDAAAQTLNEARAILVEAEDTPALLRAAGVKLHYAALLANAGGRYAKAAMQSLQPPETR